jgi:BirA family biotin operon repressor/biotin-[acetyl-CoA-carboxylase] ligase
LRYNVFMQTLKIANPFGAPVYYAECVSSTMDAARSLEASGVLSGSVIVADFQEQGRGRIGRSWEAGPGSALLFTLLLRYAGLDTLPQALTLRTGLALALAIEAFAPALRAEIKWPNDIMLGGKKAAGILTDSDGKAVYIGIGVNVSQKEFSPGLKDKAASIALALGEGGKIAETPESRPALLEKILKALHAELESGRPWLDRLESRLYLKEKTVRFAPGGPDSELVVEGILKGVGPGGELLIAPVNGASTDGSPENSSPENSGEVKSFISGELRVYGAAML